jgi:glycosyltransferase involved in cell wall biosynthesis
VYAGTIGLAQGLDVALDAMAGVATSHPDARLVLVGGGSDYERIAGRLASEGLRTVRLLGPMPLAQVADVYRGAVAGLATLRDVPHFDGARPSKILPIMASGLPVIYSGRGEGAHLVQEAGAGVVVSPEDPRALTGAIVDILDHPDRAAAMGRRGRRHAVDNFAWDDLVGSWLDQLNCCRTTARGRSDPR